MLDREEELKVINLAIMAKREEQMGVKFIPNISTKEIAWLAEKLREINTECSKVHLELQQTNEELARVYEVYGP